MAFGILEPKTDRHVPGTVLLSDLVTQATDHPNADTGLLKHGTGKNSHIILAPQPSEDPNDPLNWSFFEKHLILGILCLGSIVNAAAPGPVLQAGVAPIALQLGVTFTQVAMLAGYVLLAAGAMGIFVSGLARKFGKRPLYVFSSTMSVVGCIIGQCATDYHTLIGARVVQGLGVSAYESLIISSIGDLFFVHERGPRVAVVMFILAAITNGILIIAGPITANLGWHYNFHILLPFVALQLILTILFVPETTYRRDKIYDIDTTGSDQNLDRLAATEEQARVRKERKLEHGEEIEKTVSRVSTTPSIRRKTFVQRMALYNGVFVQDSLLKMIIAPVVILFNAGAAYNVLVSGIVLAWYVGMSIVSTVIFSSPPYTLSAAGVGYTSVAPLIGGTLGSLFMGIASDRQLKWMVSRNKGIYEPEFRIPLITVGLVTCIAGLIGFGYSVRNLETIYVICVPWAIMMFGMNVVATVTTGYALDAFREHSTEIFIMNMLFKNFFYYGLTNYVIDWFFVQGPVKMFNIITGITVACILTSIPMYIYGKKYRHYWAHHNLIKILRLETDKTGTEDS